MVRTFDEIDFLEAVLEIKRSKVSQGLLTAFFGFWLSISFVNTILRNTLRASSFNVALKDELSRLWWLKVTVNFGHNSIINTVVMTISLKYLTV